MCAAFGMHRAACTSLVPRSKARFVVVCVAFCKRHAAGAFPVTRSEAGFAPAASVEQLAASSVQAVGKLLPETASRLHRREASASLHIYRPKQLCTHIFQIFLRCLCSCVICIRVLLAMVLAAM